MKKLVYTWYHGGGFIEGATPQELVNSLRNHLYGEAPNMDGADYMANIALYCQRLQPGTQVRSDSAVHLVFDLIEGGFLNRPVPTPGNDILLYASLYMKVAAPEWLPAKWDVVTEILPIEGGEKGLMVSVRGWLGPESTEVKRTFSVEQLVKPSVSWHSRAKDFGREVYYGA
jgi:hypothetical protein